MLRNSLDGAEDTGEELDASGCDFLRSSWRKKEVQFKDIARIAALQIVSVGGILHTLSGDDTHAEVVITGWPADEWLSGLGLTQRDSDPLWNIFHPIMDYLGIRYSWQRQDDGVRMTFTRESTRP